MLRKWTLESALQEIAESELRFEEIFVPARVEPPPHSPYLPGYEWLFAVERRLARLLEPWLKDERHRLIGSGGLLSEALSNAYCHGHGRDPSRPITVQIHVGRRGLLVRVEDTGPGFRVEEVRRRCEHGGNYFHNAGNGLRRMSAAEDFQVFFTDAGRAFHFVYIFPSEATG